MRRREFVVGIGAAAVMWPIAAQPQQQGPTPVVGFLNSASRVPFAHLAAAFRKGLREEGFIEGENVVIEERWADGRYDRLPALAEDLAQRRNLVVAATGGAMSGVAAKSAVGRVPIVFVMGGDPVKFGLVASLSRPGGNITGITQLTIELAAKRLGLLHELVPDMKRVAVLLNPDFFDASPQLREVDTASAQAGFEAVIVRARTEAEFAPAFDIIARERTDAL